MLLSAASNSSGVPAKLLATIALIEIDRRPTAVRILENLLTWINFGLYVLFSAPMRDVSLGMCQVKLSKAALLMNVPVVATGAWVRIEHPVGGSRMEKIRQLWHVIRAVVNDRSNLELAARYIATLYKRWASDSGRMGYLDSTFLDYLGRQYNDSEVVGSTAFIPYSTVLKHVLSGVNQQR